MNPDVFKLTRKYVRRLHQAIIATDMKEIEESLKADFDIDYVYNGCTASKLAFLSKNDVVCSKIFSSGCDLNKPIDSEGNTILSRAVTEGSGDNLVKILLNNGADPDIHNNLDLTPVHCAASMGRISIVKLLIHKSNFINRCDSNGETALLKCCSNDHLSVAKLLLEAGADLEWTDNEMKTALIRAAESNKIDVVKFLIKAGSNVNARDRYGRTALLFASKLGYLDIVQTLVVNKAEIEKGDSSGCTPFSVAVRNVNLNVVRELLLRGCDINSTNFDLQQTALHTCICKAMIIYGQRDNQLKLFETLIAYGCSVNTPDQLGCVPLFYAAIRGESDIAKVLIQNGADLDRINNAGETLLHAAVTGNQLELTDIFLKAVNSVNNQNESPLYLAVTHKSSISIIKLLINHGANLNICEKSLHQTPLYVSILKNYMEATAELIASGCDVNMTNKAGNSPLWAACEAKNTKMVETLLRAKNIDVNLGFSFSPLHAAIKNGCVNIVKMLTAARCDVNKLTDACKSPLYLAAEKDNYEMAALLILCGADPSSHHVLKKPDRCCLMHQDPHPHLELEPLLASVENNSMKMAQLLVIASHSVPYGVLGTVKDILFRTSYARDAKLTHTSIVQYAHFFAFLLSAPRSLKETCRGIVRKHLGLYPALNIDKLNLPDQLKNYVLLTGIEMLCPKNKN